MKYLKFFVIGVIFGIVIFKSEAASWFRIYEMFQFEAFHMYGIIGSALGIGILAVYIIKKFRLRSIGGEPIRFAPKKKSFSRYMYGGLIFGSGWALAGSCPGPIYTLIGAGYISIFVVLIGALLGTFIYGLLQQKLPH